MQLRKLVLPFLIFISFALSAEELSLAAHARLIVGMQASDFDPEARIIEQSIPWKEAIKQETAKFYWDKIASFNVKNQLNKGMQKRKEIEGFCSKHFSESFSKTKNVLYLFGGADFSYPDLFFPNMENIILVGQEKAGPYPNVQTLLNSECLTEQMLAIGTSLEALPFRSYFVTSTMNREFRDYGVTTLLAAEIALADYFVMKYRKVFLSRHGILKSGQSDTCINGIHLTYRKDRNDQDRHIFYFQMNLLNKDNYPNFFAFVKKKNIDTAFYKATSFVTQRNDMDQLNTFVLKKCKYILQGESGISLRYFKPNKWKMNLFGLYARPYISSEKISPNWGVQPDLRDLYIALIWGSHSVKYKSLIEKIWGPDKCKRALAKKIIPENITWKGLLPFFFGYSGRLTSEEIRPYSSVMQYAIKISD